MSLIPQPPSPVTLRLGEGGFSSQLIFCYEKKLVIELDGGVHDDQKDYDEVRDEILSDLGNRVLRIKNEELKEIQQVLNKIDHACQSQTG